MIKIKSIPVSDSDALNKFVEKHSPLINEDSKDNGISLHDGYFLVRYEDGTYDEKSEALSKLYQTINTYRNNVLVKTIESQAITAELAKMFPNVEFTELAKKPKDWYRDYFLNQSKGNLSNEHANQLADKTLKSVRDNLMAEFEINRTADVNIPIIQAIIDSYE